LSGSCCAAREWFFLFWCTSVVAVVVVVASLCREEFTLIRSKRSFLPFRFFLKPPIEK